MSNNISVLFILRLFEVYLLWAGYWLRCAIAPGVLSDEETCVHILLTHRIVIILGGCPCLQSEHVYEVFILVDRARLCSDLLVSVLKVLEVTWEANIR